MKEFIYKLIIIMSLFCAVYVSLMYMVEFGLKKSKYLDYEQWNELYSGDVNAEIIIQGSSRAWKQVDPFILESYLGLTCYNLGMDGYQVPMQIKRTQIYLRHNHKPKYLIQVLDHFSFTQRKNLFNRDQFLPYLSDTALVSELEKYEGFTWPDYHIPFYRYIGSKETALAGLMEFSNLKSFPSLRYKGFKSDDKKWESYFDNERKNNPYGKSIQPVSWIYKLYADFAKELKNQGISLIFVYAPDYCQFQEYILNHKQIRLMYMHLANELNVPFLDYSSDSICNSKENFYNPTHLNKKGSELFSRSLSDTLKYFVKAPN